MITAPFDYEAPESVEEAIRMLHENGEDAKLLAGGHSLLPLMKVRLAAPTVLVDLRKIPGLHSVEQENGGWTHRPDDAPRRPPGHARARAWWPARRR